MKEKLVLSIIVLGILVSSGFVSAAHYMTGFVNNASDGTSANGYEVVLWNPVNGISDNLTDIIGPSGNSGADNIYFIDCEMLSTGCSVGDEIRVKIMNNGSNYVSETANSTITGSGFDVMSDLKLNSPPNVTLISPINGFNISTSNVNFSCNGADLDGNLENMSLYGNWSNGWHINETLSLSGSEDNVNFSKILNEGRYLWNCLVNDNLSISRFGSINYSLVVDLTNPNIASVGFNWTNDICGFQDYARINCTVTDELTEIDSVMINALSPYGDVNYSASLLSGDTYYADILLNQTGMWYFNCIANDSAGNYNNLTNSEGVNVRSNLSDLRIGYEDILFDNLNPIENQAVIINATIHNEGCGIANNFLVGFYEGDPGAGAAQINGNKSVSVSGTENYTVNVTWIAKLGETNIFVSIDLNDSIGEENETNNIANKSMNITAWQSFYGNISVNMVLADSDNNNLSYWLNETYSIGNIFIVDKESDVDWGNLQAIGKNASGNDTTNDFSEIDVAFNMTGFSDSVSNAFTTDGNNPKMTDSFLIHQKTILDVPIINSTDNLNFTTGLLWDVSDDLDGEYGGVEKEDIIFVTKLNKGIQGYFGIYDYEISIPVRLREYNGPDTSEVFIYFDLD